MENISFNAISKNISAQGTSESVFSAAESTAKNEFAQLFYKEILQQCFKDGFMGDGEGLYNQMTKDMFIEQLAKEFAGKSKELF